MVAGNNGFFQAEVLIPLCLQQVVDVPCALLQIIIISFLALDTENIGNISPRDLHFLDISGHQEWLQNVSSG